MREEDDQPPYRIGYKRPPVETRFRSGRSGNPRGRPKGSKNMSTLIETELDSKITVNESGARHEISKRQAIAKQLVNKAVMGDPRALPLLLSEIRAQASPPPGASPSSEWDDPADTAGMASILRRMRARELEPEETMRRDTTLPSASSPETAERPPPDADS